MTDLIQPVNICKLVDERGVVVGLQPELIDAISRQIAIQKSKVLHKIHSICPIYTSSVFQKMAVERRKLAPKGENHACFTIVSPNTREKRNEIQTLSEMGDEELMLEVEILRICDQAFRNSKLSQRYEMKVSSSELLDALFEECSVDLADRIPLLQLIFEQQARGTSMTTPAKSNEVSNQARIRLELNKISDRGANVTKLLELMKIKGSCDQIEKQLQLKQHIYCKARFSNVIAYFRRLEEILKLFTIYSEDPEQTDAEKEESKGPAISVDSNTSLSSSSRTSLPRQNSFKK